MMSYTYEDGISGKRLITKFIQRSDAPFWVPFLSDPLAIQFFPSHPLNPAQRSEEWMGRQVQRYQDQKYGLQWLLHQETGARIGQCGLLMQEVDGVAELEVGYHIFPQFWGRGYAPEAASMFMNYAKTHQLSDTIAALIRVGNVKSERVAQKLEMNPEKQTHWNGMDIRVWRKFL